MSIKNTFALFLCVSLSVFGIIACGDDAVEEPSTENEADGGTFAETALPIFEANGCNVESCHGGSGALGGGLALETFENLTSAREGTFVPCDSENSSIITKLGEDPPFGIRMPLGGDPLSSEDVETLTNWVNAGSDVTPLCE